MNMLNDDDRRAVMAFVDGELTSAEVAAFEARLATEPALEAEVERALGLKSMLKGAFDPVVEEAVPDRLLAMLAGEDAVEPASVIAPAPARTSTSALASGPRGDAANEGRPPGTNDAHRAALPARRRWRWQEWGAMAACLVLGVALGARVLAPGASSDQDGATLALAGDGLTAQGALREALEQRTGGGGDKTMGPVAVGLSFRNHARDYCRTFSLAGGTSGIACKQQGAWAVAQWSREAAASAPAADGYRMAASPFSAALIQAVDAMREGETLDAAGEAAAKARGWE